MPPIAKIQSCRGTIVSVNFGTPKSQRTRRVSSLLCNAARKNPLSQPPTNAPNPILVKTLESTLQAISKFVQEADKRNQKQRKNSLAEGKVQVEITDKGKLVTFKAGSQADRLIKAPHLPGRSLGDYLALPLDSYSLLDPRWISRDVQQPGLFHLKIPLQELVGLPLEPRISIKVDVDAENGQVRFQADRFVVGEPKFDESFKFVLKATLQNKAVPDVSPSILSADFWKSSSSKGKEMKSKEGETFTQSSATISEEVMASSQLQSEADSQSLAHPMFKSQLKTPVVEADAIVLETDILERSAEGINTIRSFVTPTPVKEVDSSGSFNPETAVPSDGPESKSSDHVERPMNACTSEGRVDDPARSADFTTSSALLWCQADVSIEVMVPSPLSAAPKPLLNLAASLITKFTMQQLMPGFLQLLSIDYERWASGKPQARSDAAGNLLSNAKVTTSAGKTITLHDSQTAVDVSPQDVRGVDSDTSKVEEVQKVSGAL